MSDDEGKRFGLVITSGILSFILLILMIVLLVLYIRDVNTIKLNQHYHHDLLLNQVIQRIANQQLDQFLQVLFLFFEILLVHYHYCVLDERIFDVMKTKNFEDCCQCL